MTRWKYQRDVLERAKAIPIGAWSYVQQFEIRHLIADLVEAYKLAREENRALRAKRDAPS